MARVTSKTGIDWWGVRSRFYGCCESSDARRWAAKVRLFSRCRGRTLLIAAGTGLDFRHLPPGEVVAIELSSAMLARAVRRVHEGPARVRLVKADAEALPFEASVFETIVTSCTLCSVPDAAAALSEMRRVLAPGGRLLIFEHVRSHQPMLGLVLDLMTLWTRVGGTAMNRRTLATVAAAGFDIIRVESVFLDIILAVEASRPGDP